MVKAYDRIRRGTDSSGRPIVLNARMDAALKDVEAELARRDQPAPIITQGAYMGGAGATASAGVHDAGGALDFRTRHLTAEQKKILVRVLRKHGWAAWQRNLTHGGFKDEHVHAVLLGDREAAPGARDQMVEYRAGGDGLKGTGKDYHWRPDPIPTFSWPAWQKRQRAKVSLPSFKRRHLTNALKAAQKGGNPNRVRLLRRWIDQLK